MTNYKKIIFLFMLVAFFATGVVIPKPARAQFVDAIGGPSQIVQTIWQKIEKVYDRVKSIVGAEVTNRTVGMFLDSLAYDVATELASGGQGGKPLFRTVSIKKSIENAGNQALGEFLGQLTEKGFDDLGINLCDPSIDLKLTLTLGIIDEAKPPKPKCDWNRLKKNWEQFDDKIQGDIIKFQLNPKQSGQDSVRGFWDYITSPTESDLGIAFRLNQKLIEQQTLSKEVEALSRIECQGFIDKKTPISNEVITHCSTFEGMSKGLFTSAVEVEAARQRQKELLAKEGKLSDILKEAANKFVNTFTSKLMKNWIKRGMWSLFGGDDPYENYRDTLIDRLRGGADILQPRGVDIFKDIKKVQLEELDSYSFINDFAVCPTQFRSPENCIISPAFLQAINSQLTVQQAIDRGIIDGSMPFVHPDDRANHTIDKCYRDGFCYANLVKLRKANVIPVGWELAALRQSASLQQVIDCFEESAKCQFGRSSEYAVGGNDHNPFYHLVDPDWVLKAPPARCDAYSFSPILESSESPNRQQYCADPKICLRSDTDGNCIDNQYNYCTRSENTWNFDGKSCDNGEIYAGCLTFESKDAGSGSYIQDTLDYCTANQAGCRRYSQDIDGAGNWVLEDIAVDDNDLFFNRQVADCSEDYAGCSEYIIMTGNDPEAYNLIPNGSFEDWNRDGFPDTWYNTEGELTDGIDDPSGADNGLGISVDYDGDIIPVGYHWGTPNYGNNTSEAVKTGIILEPNTSYRLAFDSAQYNNGDHFRSRVRMFLCNNETGCGAGTLADNVNGQGNCVFTNGANVVELWSFNYTDQMQRVNCSFMTNEYVDYASLEMIGMPPWPADPTTDWRAAILFDNLKLEKVEDVSSPATAYSDSDYKLGATVYMNANTFMCSADEVGCQGYIPANGDPMIPAVITQDDLCPAECVGYDTFTEQPNIFDRIEGDNLVEYYNFIADTARQCPDQEIGCEEFTNLDIVAQGGEGREYFTYLRQCVTPNLGATYYTWEGTEVAGYQIKTWNALPSNLDKDPGPDTAYAPCTNMAPAGSNCLDVLLIDNGAQELNEEAACGIHTADWKDDPEFDPNCREFFDIYGNIFYRFQDRTIFATDNCHDYRRTATDQVYRAVPEESTSCSAVNNGCRSYYGNNANNIRDMAIDNFEQGTYSPWMAWNGTLDLSNESLDNNGHSLRMETGGGISRNIAGLGLQNNREYIASWWMKADASLSDLTIRLVGIDMGGNVFDVHLVDPTIDSNFQNIEAGRWHYYTSSVYFDAPNVDLENIFTAELMLSNNSSLDGQGLYIDNFKLREVENNFSVVRNSWNTPLSCDDPYEGYHLGCQAYTDLNGRNFNLKSFDHLCREGAIGCLPAIRTQNSSNPFEFTYNVGDYSEITVPVDEKVYLVPDSNNYCPRADKGCIKLGLPDRLDPNKFSTVYKINDPDRYSSIMCNADGLNCSEYNTAKGIYYLKDPATNTCTYQQNVVVDGNELSGWFKTSSLSDNVPLGCADQDGNPYDNNGLYDVAELILPRDYCSVSDTDPIQLFYYTQEDCQNNGGYWNDYNLAAQCPASEDLCTSFKDPADPIGCDPKGRNIDFVDYEGFCWDGAVITAEDNQIDCEINGNDWIFPSRDGYCNSNVYNNQKDCEAAGWRWTPYCEEYYYYDDKNIDETSCNGLADRDDGCVLFYDANNWNGEHSQVVTLYDTDETYENIEVEDKAQSPVVCDPSFDPNCRLTANRLIQVDKDRQCAEWLACKSSTATYDEDSHSYKIVCDDLDTCLEFQYDPDSNTTKCKKWGSYDEEVEALTIEKYQSRATGLRDHISWGDKDYTGYSIPNLLPIKELNVYNFGQGENRMSRLAYDVVNRIDADGPYNSQCVGRDLNGNRFAVNGGPCSTDEINLEGDYVFRGECQDSVCWVSPEVNSVSTSTYSIETRAYAIADAPFPAAIEEDGVTRLSQYNKANICSTADNSCEESFQKITYGGTQETVYYPANAQSGSIPIGICTSGITTVKLSDGRTVPNECPTGQNWECDSFDEHGNRRGDGMCAVITEQILFQNWPGICLEHDNRTTLVKDNEYSYYCDQWYPAQKIQGTASLYDNYRAAGYYDATGRDALFCTVAEPYRVAKDRYYCGYFTAGHDCNVLLKVPEGSKINLDQAQLYPELLDIGSWMEEAPASSARVSTLTVMPGGTRLISGSNFLDEATIGNSGAKFSRFDNFNNVLAETFNFMEIIDDMFDAPAGIGRFYWDVDVSATGASNSSAFVKLENDTYYRSGGNCRNCPSWNGTCPSNYHLAYERCSMGGNCGWHRWRNAVTYCNPFSTAYYVNRASTEEVEQTYVGSCTSNCKFTDISIPEANHGRGCLQNAGIAPEYRRILTTYGAPGNFPWVTSQLNCVAAAEDPEACAFVACIENLSLNQSADHSCNSYGDCLRYIIGENGALTVSQTLYGETAKCFGDGYYDHDLNSATDPISAAAPIPDHVGPLPMYDPNDGSAYNNCLDLNRESFETEEELTAYCSSCRLDDLPFFNYNTVSQGTDCDANPITCYQQCRVLTQLDSEGLVSALRTDIWWRSAKRSAEGNEGRVSLGLPWISWYANEAGYTSSTQPNPADDEVLYGIIAGLSGTGGQAPEDYPSNFSHFGAGLAVFDPDFIVSTRAPYYRVSPNNITAGTFFSYFQPPEDPDTAMNRAHLQLQELFYRAYNWEWDFASTTYKTIEPEPNFPLDGGNNNNYYAGPEYRPRILAACGDNLCNITDLSGNILDVETGITVNNKTQGNLIGLEGSLFVSAKFFYHAHPDHMPVTDIGANWGDEASVIFSSSPGKYKNSLPVDYCDPTRDAPGDTFPITINREPQQLGFAGTDGACQEGYKIFYHNYLYDETHAHDCNGGFGAPGTPPRPVVPNASCYQPFIRVVDNWGWDQIEPFNGWIIVHDD